MADVTAAGLINKLGRITSELQQCYRELATVESGRNETFRNTWQASLGESIAAKNREAEWSVVDLDSVMIEIKGKIQALSREYDYYELYLTNLDRINNDHSG